MLLISRKYFHHHIKMNVTEFNDRLPIPVSCMTLYPEIEYFMRSNCLKAVFHLIIIQNIYYKK